MIYCKTCLIRQRVILKMLAGLSCCTELILVFTTIQKVADEYVMARTVLMQGIMDKY